MESFFAELESNVVFNIVHIDQVETGLSSEVKSDRTRIKFMPVSSMDKWTIVRCTKRMKFRTTVLWILRSCYAAIRGAAALCITALVLFERTPIFSRSLLLCRLQRDCHGKMWNVVSRNDTTSTDKKTLLGHRNHQSFVRAAPLSVLRFRGQRLRGRVCLRPTNRRGDALR